MYQLTGSFYNNNNKTHTKTGLSSKHLDCFSIIVSGRVSQPSCYWLWVDKACFVLCTIRQLPALLLASTYYKIAVPHVDLVKCLLERESICPVETIGLRVLPGEAVSRKGKPNSQNVLKFSFFHRPRLELAGRISLGSFLRSGLRSFIGKRNIVPWIYQKQTENLIMLWRCISQLTGWIPTEASDSSPKSQDWLFDFPDPFLGPWEGCLTSLQLVWGWWLLLS